MAGVGNPNPLGRKSDKIIRDALLAVQRQEPERLKRLAEKWWDNAEAGDQQAMNSLADRIDGKPLQTLASDPENPLIPAGENLAAALLKSIPTEALTRILAERADDNTLGH